MVNFKIRRWDERPRHDSARPGEVDFAQWHKDTFGTGSYCMDVDKFEYRFDPSGQLRVVGVYELIRWGWRHSLAAIPQRLAPHEGKVRVLTHLGRILSEGEGAQVPSFFVWHRPDLSEFLVSRVEDWTGEPIRAGYLGQEHFRELIENLPGWRWSAPVQERQPPCDVGRRDKWTACAICGVPQEAEGRCVFCGGPLF